MDASESSGPAPGGCGCACTGGAGGAADSVGTVGAPVPRDESAVVAGDCGTLDAPRAPDATGVCVAAGS